jgi:phosphoglycerate dehydrogenase-like enzyme
VAAATVAGIGSRGQELLRRRSTGCSHARRPGPWISGFPAAGSPPASASVATVTVVSLPGPSWLAALEPLPDPLSGVVWDLEDDPGEYRERLGVVVLPYRSSPVPTGRLDGLPALRLVQTLTAGYDDVLPFVPSGVALANAGGVHDASTAELAVTLALASLRGIPEAVRAAGERQWTPERRRALADSRVLLVGVGGVGTAVAARLAPFEVTLTRVGSRARDDAAGRVHGPHELPDLLPHADVVVLACPLTPATRGLVDAAFLAAMPDGALLVNVSRGPVVDTQALLAELRAQRLQAALDVVDPEPLPAEHPLWSAPGLLLTPHVGGGTSAFRPRALALLRTQLARVAAGEAPLHVVAGPGAGA